MASQPYFNLDKSEEEAQRKWLYNRYLHWSTQQEDEFFDRLVPVNIADFDNTTNLFYRDVRKG